MLQVTGDEHTVGRGQGDGEEDLIVRIGQGGHRGRGLGVPGEVEPCEELGLHGAGKAEPRSGEDFAILDEQRVIPRGGKLAVGEGLEHEIAGAAAGEGGGDEDVGIEHPARFHAAGLRVD